ncbi:MAG: NtrZ family periplasmic regulatory protein [Pseudomonadota bacterium]
MKTLLIASFAASASFALPAVAEQPVDAQVLGVDAPTLSETEKAEPDWYRQFTIAPPVDPLGFEPSFQSTDDDLSFQIRDAGRWTFSFDVTNRPEDSPLPQEEMSAGATFQITPRFSVGGDLSVGADGLDEQTDWTDEEVEAGIRLRSAFRF